MKIKYFIIILFIGLIVLLAREHRKLSNEYQNLVDKTMYYKINIDRYSEEKDCKKVGDILSKLNKHYSITKSKTLLFKESKLKNIPFIDTKVHGEIKSQTVSHPCIIEN